MTLRLENILSPQAGIDKPTVDEIWASGVRVQDSRISSPERQQVSDPDEKQSSLPGKVMHAG